MVTAHIAPDDSLGECRLRWGDGSADEIAWSLELLEALYKVSSYDTESALLARQFDRDGAVTASFELPAGFPAGQSYEPGIDSRPSATRKVWMP